MKKTIYKAEDRGFTNHQWLKSYHTFSFANYYEEDKSGFGKLMVVNEDLIQPDSGFGTKFHENMEIINIPLAGSLTHKDDLGNNRVIGKGDVQAISAGSGITHSEFNSSATEALHQLEIWILPDRVNKKPNYQQKHFDLNYGRWTPIIRPDGKYNSMTIFQHISLYLGKFKKDQHLFYTSEKKDHGIFIMVIGGRIVITEETLHPYDAIALEKYPEIKFQCLEDSDILLIEVTVGNENYLKK